MGLAEQHLAFARLGTRVYALSLQEKEPLEDLQGRLGDAVTLLSDPSGAAAEAFGVRDPSPFPAREMARAATFHIDREGVIRQRWLPDSYRERPEAGDILTALSR